ncbi:hypothetical protein ACFWMG_44320 [Streptomyces sp. NPDC127074]|uniref:hypothetical protein n=1 Tax=Streptomyces sp. NPDC127074 TaxID=3347130 RepID=UPI00364AF11D
MTGRSAYASTSPAENCDLCEALLRRQAEYRRKGDVQMAAACVRELQWHYKGPMHQEES